MTRCATLMPSPMMFTWSFRSFTSRTGPRFTPRRTGTVLAMSRTDIAANNASSGSPMKVTAAPSPVSRMMRSAAATWSSALASTALNSCLSCSCSATGFLEYSTMSRKSTLQTSVRLELSITDLRPNAARRPRRRYFTRMPGCAPASGETRKISGPSPEAASTMPSETPNFIFRGARFATTTVSRPSSFSGA